MQSDIKAPSPKWSLKQLGPGILVAATGVGAGDLATAAFTGAALGKAILWAVIVGAVLKYALNEGLARWQLATGTTILEGSVKHLGKFAGGLFLVYLILWSFLVAMALMAACGVAASAIFPIFENQESNKILYGIAHSIIAASLVIFGGYQIFEKVMSLCIGVMFVVVIATAMTMLEPSKLSEIAWGLFVPTIPKLDSNGLGWTIALLGGVGGTVTVLCYGYWIRESDRSDLKHLPFCRIDLVVGYVMTALFGVSMILIGSEIGELNGKGASLIVAIGNRLDEAYGPAGYVLRWAFLVGAWGAVSSSLLGVWQAIPYLFWDLVRTLTASSNPQTQHVTTTQPATESAIYRIALALIATLPIIGLCGLDFKAAMKIYGIVGAFFIPLLTISLLFLNRKKFVGSKAANGWLTISILILALSLFGLASCFTLGKMIWPSQT